MSDSHSNLRPEDVLMAYRCGYFPMADSADADEFHWYDPPLRGQLSIDRHHIPKRLRRTVLDGKFDVRINTAFENVIDECAQTFKGKRNETWINKGIRDLFVSLNKNGHAHSVECWQDEKLVGGLYGLAFGGGAFSGESMFSRQTDASKVALVHLCARLWRGGFTVLDTQFINDHLKQFGAYEVSSDEYRRVLAVSLAQKATFDLKNYMVIGEKQLVAEYFLHNAQ